MCALRMAQNDQVFVRRLGTRAQNGRNGFDIIPVDGKEAKLPKWPTKGRSTKDGIKRWANPYPNHNYAIICSGFFVLEIDLDGADFLRVNLTAFATY